MKKYLYLAAALFAAAACSREEIIPEEPEIQTEKKPIAVKLVAGNPETRTEVRDDDGVLKPYWSEGDGILFFTTEIPQYSLNNSDFYDYIESGFFLGTLLDNGLKAEFTGEVYNSGEFIAVYPNWKLIDIEEEEWEWIGPSYRTSYNYSTNTYDGFLDFNIPPIQYPTATSFDPDADLLISAPFTIGPNDIGDEDMATVSTEEIPVYFARANAIVKVVLKDMTNNGKGGKLNGHVVKSVTLGRVSSGGEEYVDYVSETRAGMVDENGNGCGLSGHMEYNLGSGIYNYYDTYGGVTANYTADTEYSIGESGAATFLITTPCVLTNDYDGGLRVQIETDHEIIYRDVTLPEDGLALQPSRVTTLRIGLYDEGVNYTYYDKKGLNFREYVTYEGWKDVEEVTLDNGDYVQPVIRFLDVPLEDVSDLNLSVDPAGAVIFDFDDAWIDSYDRYIYGIKFRAQAEGTAVVTASFGNYSASLTFHVNPASPIIEMDEHALALCIYKGWDTNDDGFISQKEAAAVTSLNKVFYYGNYSYNSTWCNHAKAIKSLDALQYFTGLQQDLQQYEFYGCESLESIVLPASVTVIPEDAFYNCKNLTSVTTLGEITTIEKEAFGYSGITNVDDLLEHATRVGNFAFSNCPITTVNMNGNTQYGIGAFLQTKLVSVVLPSSMTEIPNRFFESCKDLESVTIPDGVVTIGDWAFGQCESLGSVTLPSSLTSIGASAFYGTSLTSITFPANLTHVGNNAFQGTLLESVSLPVGVSSVGDYAFSSCTSLTEASLPSTLESLGTYAFSGCASLHTVSMPATLNSLGQYCFSGCTQLVNVTIPQGFTTLSYSVFKNCSSLKSIVIPDGITQIYKEAFYGCTSLETITIPSTVQSIGESAFYNCSSLVDVVIPGKLKTLGQSAFSLCSNLQSISFDFQATGSISFGSFVFSKCTSLISIVIPDRVTTLPEGLLFSCTNLTSVQLPENLETINARAFDACSALRTIVLPASLTTVGTNAFRDVIFCSGNGYDGVKFLGSTPPTTMSSAIFGYHWNGTNWTAAGVTIYVPTGSSTAYSAVANIVNTNNVIEEY